MTGFRKLNDDDNIKKVALWIYSSNAELFDKIFLNKSHAVSAIGKLITSEYINPYHRKFITVLYQDNPNLICAIAVSFKGSEITLPDTFDAFRVAGNVNIKRVLLYELVSIMFSSHIKYNDYYLANLYVDKKYRKKNLVVKLIEKIKQKARQTNSNNLFIDIECDNLSLIDFYSKLDFERYNLNYHTIIRRRLGYTSMIYKIK